MSTCSNNLANNNFSKILPGVFSIGPNISLRWPVFRRGRRSRQNTGQRDDVVINGLYWCLWSSVMVGFVLAFEVVSEGDGLVFEAVSDGGVCVGV